MTYKFNNQAGDYAAQGNDYFIGEDTTVAPYTVTLPASPNWGQTYVIKDTAGAAATNNITIDGNGINIDNSSTLVISENFGEAVLFYNSVIWCNLTTLAKSAVSSIQGNSGSPLTGNLTLETANSTPIFAGSGSTLTLDFGLSNLILGSSLPSLSGGTTNVGLGQSVLNSLTSGTSCTCIGNFSGNAITSGSGCVAIGANSLSKFSTGSAGQGSNTAIGNACLANLLTGTYNVVISAVGGASLAGAESSNILISNLGVLNESNAIRIGTQGVGLGQQNTCFIAGIAGVTVSNQAIVTVNTSGGSVGQLGEVAQVPLSLGGTNAALTASNGGIFYSTASAGAILAGTATAQQILLSGSSTTPQWSTSTFPLDAAQYDFLYATAAHAWGRLTTANNGILITSATGVPSWLTGGTTGQVLVATTSNPATWSTLSSIAVTTLTGTANQVLVNGTSATPTAGAITLTLPQSIATTSNVTFGSVLIGNGGALQTTTTTGNTMNIQVYNNTTPGYVNVLALTNGATPTAILRVSDGSSSTPSISFLNETNTGFYRNGTNTIDLTINGSQAMGWGTVAVSVLNRNFNTWPGTNNSLAGSLQFTRTAKTASYTLVQGDFLAVFTSLSGAVNATLPTPGSNNSFYFIKDESGTAQTNNISVIAQSGKTVEGNSSYVINTNNGGAGFYYDGTNWRVFASNFGTSGQQNILVGPYTFTTSAASTNEVLTVSSTNATPGNATFQALVNGTSGGDPMFQASVTGGDNWSWGLNVTDGQAWQLCNQAALARSHACIRADIGGPVNLPLTASVRAVKSASTTNATGDGNGGGFGLGYRYCGSKQ